MSQLVWTERLGATLMILGWHSSHQLRLLSQVVAGIVLLVVAVHRHGLREHVMRKANHRWVHLSCVLLRGVCLHFVRDLSCVVLLILEAGTVTALHHCRHNLTHLLLATIGLRRVHTVAVVACHWVSRQTEILRHHLTVSHGHPHRHHRLWVYKLLLHLLLLHLQEVAIMNRLV